MPVHSSTIICSTEGFIDVHDLTSDVRKIISESHVANGTVIVFVPGSTAGITTIEFERGAIEDLKKAIERIAPQDIHYAHNVHWNDGNGFAHVRAALLGPSLAIPLKDGNLRLGTWQQIVLIDFDNRPRSREIHVQIIGE
ncbi:MAG: YjbQ family protein [Ignavibacteriae bacterium]|nr:YjbQ family protein [Ignavibacteria bacterium]MBI3364108.1 YjbQ family protein [Ignavibacteriota bacterium]